MLNNPHFQNLLLLIGSIVAYNMEGHSDPAWLALTIFLIFWGWFKDIKISASIVLMNVMMEEFKKLNDDIDSIVQSIKEKPTKK